MRQAISILVFLASVALPGYPQTKPRRTVSQAKLGEVLNCLQVKLASIGGGPPRGSRRYFLVRYYYGVLTPGDDDPNELQVAVYARHETSARLYSVYFDKKGDQPQIYVGEWGGTLKRENGKMVVDVNPGGLGTYYHIKHLLRVMSESPVMRVPNRYVRPGPDVCVYQP